MKIMNNIIHRPSHFFQIVCFLLGGLLMSVTPPVFSQAETTNDTTSTRNNESAEKQKLRIGFDAFKINDELKLQVSLKLKVEGRFQNVEGVEISFYKGDAVEPSNLLGKATSNMHGVAYLMITATAATDTSAGKTYLASVQDNPKYKDAEETVVENKVVMEMNLDEADSVRTVKVFVGKPDGAGKITPVTGAACQVYVKRLFGVLPIGEAETTDEDGRIEIEFPKDIKGDEAGNIIVIARVEDNEVVGNVEANKTVMWGIPTKVDDFYTQRQLWSARANAPIPLVILVNLVLIGVWGSIAFIFLEIARINKIGKNRAKP